MTQIQVVIQDPVHIRASDENKNKAKGGNHPGTNIMGLSPGKLCFKRLDDLASGTSNNKQ